MSIADRHFFFSHAALAVSDTNERGAALKAPAAALETLRIKEMPLEKPTDARARRRHQSWSFGSAEIKGALQALIKDTHLFSRSAQISAFCACSGTI